MIASIFCLVYNHENYLRQTLDGFLMQKTNFDFEIVVGEDCSTDNSRNILLEYKVQHPTKFKLLLHEKNIGMVENVIATLEACTGNYVALCDGDDYWTDPNKLQKQVDFLEKNKEFSICYHRVKILNDLNGEIKDEILNTFLETKEYDILDLAKGNLMHTPSVVFRNNQLSLSKNEKFKESPASDYFIHMLNARFGKIKYLPDSMAIYRENSTSSVWSAHLDKIFFKATKISYLLLLEFAEDNNESLKKILIDNNLNLFKIAVNNYSEKSRGELSILIMRLVENSILRKKLIDFLTDEMIPDYYKATVQKNSITLTFKNLILLINRNFQKIFK